MKTKLSFFFLLLFNTFSLYAIVLDDPDTTHIIIRPIISPNPGDTPINNGPKIPLSGNTIIGDLYGTTLCFSSSSFVHSSIEVIITDSNEIENINTIVYEYNNEFIINISSLLVGVYTISIKDGDDEYIGEFEVF